MTNLSITEPAVILAAWGRGPVVQRYPPILILEPPRLTLEQWLAACFQVVRGRPLRGCKWSLRPQFSWASIDL